MKIDVFKRLTWMYQMRKMEVLDVNGVNIRTLFCRNLIDESNFSSNVTFNIDVVLGTRFIFVKRMAYNKLRDKFPNDNILEMLLFRVTGRFELNRTNQDYFSEDVLAQKDCEVANIEDYRTFELLAKNYFRLWDSEVLFNVKRKPYGMKMNRNPIPTEFQLLDEVVMDSELEVLEFPYFRVDKDNLELVKDKMLEVYKVVQDYNYLFLNKTRKHKTQDSFRDTSTLITETAKWSEENLSLTRVRKWLMTRHNLFGAAVCSTFDWETTIEDFDVNLQTRFNYFGEDCNKTPDMVMEIRDIVYIIDFKVTDKDAGNRYDETYRKYERLREGLSRHLGQRVEIAPFVWKICAFSVLMCHEAFSTKRFAILRNETLKILEEIQRNLLQMKGYEDFKSKLEDVDDEADDISKLNLFDDLMMKHIATATVTGKNSINLKHSRGEMKGKETFIKIKDQDIYKDLVSTSKMDYKEYTNRLKVDLTMLLEKNEVPGHLKPVVEFNPIDLDMQIEKVCAEGLEKRQKVNMNPNARIPKLFKFPIVDWYSNHFRKMNLRSGYCPYFEVEKKLPDGTMLLSPNWELEEMDRSVDEFVEEGIGFDMEEDLVTFSNIMDFLKDTNDNFSSDKTSFFNTFSFDTEFEEIYNKLTSTNVWSIVEFWSDLIMNISYLNGRRHVEDKRDGHTVFKKFDNYYLLVRRGAMLTSEKQINFKVIVHKEDTFQEKSDIFHNWYEMKRDPRMVQSKWMAISVTDIKHFVKLKHVTLALASDLRDKNNEKKMEKEEFDILNPSFITTMMIMMEHKKGTSTTNQLNRYLMHSALAVMTNRKKLVEDIVSDPIRSRLDAYMKVCQLRWYRISITESTDLSIQRIRSLNTTDTNYDRVMVRSIYDPNRKIEFAEAMNEIYTGNLFEKESGFTDHKLKKIVAKMMEAEMNFLKIRDTMESKGEVSDKQKFMMGKDTFHTFDKGFVVSATKNWFEKKSVRSKVQESIALAISDTIIPSMRMKSSLYAGPLISDCLEFSNQILKDKSFLTLFREIQKLNTHTLLGMVSRSNILDAVFAIFPKNQIGPPREILIQAVMMRFNIKFLERMSESFCNLHEKEMLTKDKLKSQIQSEKMSEFRELVMMNKKRGKSSLCSSMNMDSSRWSPGFVVEHFLYFVYNWEVDDQLKDFLLTVITSFSSKKLLVPDKLKDKWRRKDLTQVEFNQFIQSFREACYEGRGVVTMFSGTGQGMFHFLSSIYHCVMDDYVDELVGSVLKDNLNINLYQKSLISSDDKTKMTLFTFHKNGSVAKGLKWYVCFLDMLYRLANIHTNWKKSAFHLIITEFNSLFSIGKRMLWASSKDIYNSVSLPDLTRPESAVQFALSNARRCMEHGTYLPTLRVINMLNRKLLMTAYAYTREDVESLCEELNCTTDLLPHQLGFVPQGMVYETLIYGPEIHMFKDENSDKLNEFYKKLYSANTTSGQKYLSREVPFAEMSYGKYWFELPAKLDTRLKKMKKDFYREDLRMSEESAQLYLEVNSLNINMDPQDMTHYNHFVMDYFSGQKRNFEFQETMVVHSLVRALQMAGHKGMMMPISEEVIQKSKRKNKLYRLIVDKGLDTDENVEEFNKLVTDLGPLNCDMLDFVKAVLNLPEMGSAIGLLEGLRNIVRTHEWVVENLMTMVKVEKNTHPMMRSMRFYSSSIGADASVVEVMNYIMDPSYWTSTRISNNFLSICTAMGRFETSYDTLNEALLEPFNFIRHFMNYNELPFHSFRNFLDYYHKNMRFVKFNMISDLPCTGNMKENLLNLYRTRYNPAFVLESRENFKRTNKQNEFLNMMALGEYDQDTMDMYEGIENIDTKLDCAMKLLTVSGDDENLMRNIPCDKVFFRWDKVRKRKVWTNMKFYVIMQEQMDADYLYMYNSTNEEDFKSSKYLYALLTREVNDCAARGRKVFSMTTEKKDPSWGFEYNKVDVMVKTDVKFLANKFQVWMNVRIDNEGFENEFYQGSFCVLTEKYSMDTEIIKNFEFKDGDLMSQVMCETPCLVELDTKFREQNWVSGYFIPRSKRLTGWTGDEDRRLMEKYNRMTLEQKNESVREFNEDFGNISLKDTVSEMTAVKVQSEEMFTVTEENNLGVQLVQAMRDFRDAIEIEPDQKAAQMSDRKSISSVMDMLVTQAIRNEIEVDLVNSRQVAKFIKRKDRNVKAFHRLLIYQIYNYPIVNGFNHEFSDGMVMMIYNILVKRMMTSIDLGITPNLELMSDVNVDRKFTLFYKKINFEEGAESLAPFMESGFTSSFLPPLA